MGTSVLSGSPVLLGERAGGCIGADAKAATRARAAQPGILLPSLPALLGENLSCTVSSLTAVDGESQSGDKGLPPCQEPHHPQGKHLQSSNPRFWKRQMVPGVSSPAPPQALTCPMRKRRPSTIAARFPSSWAQCMRAHSSLTGSRATSQQQVSERFTFGRVGRRGRAL